MKRLALNTLLVVMIIGVIVFFATNTIHAPDEPANNAVFQTYDNGFMLWRSDMNCVYTFAYSAQQPDSNVILMPDAENNYAYCTPVTQAPETAFTRLIADYELESQLGDQLTEAITYTFDLPTFDESNSTSFSGSPFDQLQMPLPDGRLLWCGVRAATAGTCHLTDAETGE